MSILTKEVLLNREAESEQADSFPSGPFQNSEVDINHVVDVMLATHGWLESLERCLIMSRCDKWSAELEANREVAHRRIEACRSRLIEGYGAENRTDEMTPMGMSLKALGL